MGRPELISSRLPRAIHYFQHPFDDPSEVEGSEEEKIVAFRHTRDEIKEWIIERFADLKIDNDQ
jgi:hypothetical protein